MSLGLLKQNKLERVAGGGRERGSQLPLGALSCAHQAWSVSGIQVTAGLGFQRSMHCLKLCSCMAAREGVRLAGVLLAIGVDAVVAGVVAALIGRGSVRILGLRYCSLESLYREPQKNVSHVATQTTCSDGLCWHSQRHGYDDTRGHNYRTRP